MEEELGEMETERGGGRRDRALCKLAGLKNAIFFKPHVPENVPRLKMLFCLGLSCTFRPLFQKHVHFVNQV